MTNSPQFAKLPPLPKQATIRRGGVAQLLIGIVVALIALPGLIRGASALLFAIVNADIARDGLLGESLGVLIFQLLLGGVGALLIVLGSRKLAANSRVRAAAGAPQAG
jgi:hypothetical protein